MNHLMSLGKRGLQSPRFFLAALLMLVVSMTAVAQALTVHGTVTDNTGEPVIGGTVMVVGTQNGVATDIDGNYTLNKVPANGKLEFRYVGYNTVVEEIGRAHV